MCNIINWDFNLFNHNKFICCKFVNREVKPVIYDYVIGELKARNVQDADKFGPFYIISYACHAFNLHNKAHRIFTQGGIVKSMRVPVIHMGPPGCGKTYFLEQMSDKTSGILQKLPYKLKFEQKMTDAGLVGTVSPNPQDPENPVVKKGVAETHKDSLILIDEFSDLMKESNSSFAVKNETMLAALDSGRVINAMANGEYEYETNFTLWCGVQPVKSDMSGGIGRRLCIILNIPTKESKLRYKKASRASDNVRVDESHMNDLTTLLNMWTTTISMIEHVEFTDAFYDFVECELNADNYIIELYKKMGIGYTIARFGGCKKLVVDLDDTIKEILTNEHLWRKQVMQGPEIQQILSLIESYGINSETGSTIQRVTLNLCGSEMGLSASQIHKSLMDMKSYGYVTIKNNQVTMNPIVTKYYEL